MHTLQNTSNGRKCVESMVAALTREQAIVTLCSKTSLERPSAIKLIDKALKFWPHLGDHWKEDTE